MTKRKRSDKRKDKTGVGGMFGDRVTITKVNNRVVVKNRPKRDGKKRKLTANEIAQRERFQEASRYAMAVQHDEQLKALYSARIRGKYESAYTVALADFHNAPKINEIVVNERETAGKDEIMIKAIDDFMVVRVSVEIRSAENTLIEKGEASQANKNHRGRWSYTPAVAQPTQKGMKIIAAAYDRPGNKTVQQIVVE
jgi:hypothetical protein